MYVVVSCLDVVVWLGISIFKWFLDVGVVGLLLEVLV